MTDQFHPRARVLLIPALLLVVAARAFGDEAGTTRPTPATLPSTAPASDQSTPRGAAFALYRALAAGDSQTVAECLFCETPDQQKLVDAYAAVAIQSRRFSLAVTSKFALPAEAKPPGQISPEEEDRLTAGELVETGTRATLTPPDKKRPLRMRRVGGKWKVVATDFAAATEDALPEQTKFIRSMADAMSDTSDEVEAGKFQNAVDADAALQQRLHNVMSKSFKPATKALTAPSTNPN